MSAAAGSPSRGETWELPDQRDRVIAITGANAGLGFWASLAFARAGASVVMLCRDPERAETARREILRRISAGKRVGAGSQVSVVQLDLASLGSVQRASDALLKLPTLDVLIENAGMVHVPKTREETEDGIERVVATNFIGHFALTARVLPLLERTPGSRVVTLGSLATRLVTPRLDDIQLRDAYHPWVAYAQSKIATQAFAFELDRRLRASGSGVRAASAHPGYSISGRSPRVAGVNEPGLTDRFVDNLQWAFTQGKHLGALPILRAATDALGHNPSRVDFFGPRGGVKGRPVRAVPRALTRDPVVAEAFWDEAERAAGLALL